MTRQAAVEIHERYFSRTGGARSDKQEVKTSVTAASTNCRLLYLVGGLGAGGLERQLSFLVQGMHRELYRPEMVVWNFRSDDSFVPFIRNLGIPLHLFSHGVPATQKLLMFRRLVKRLKPEVVHSYCFYTNFAAWWGTLWTNSIAFGSQQSDFVYEKRTSGPLLGRLSARWPARQICNSFTAADAIRRCRTVFAPKWVSVVRNGVDLDTFRITPLSTTGHVRIVGVGSLIPVKRWDRLLKLAQELKKRTSGFVIQIAGGGPLRETLEKQREELGVADCVQFLGYSHDIPRMLSDSTFLVHSSDTEGLPNAVLEAMACGRAVVATDAGDVPSIIDDGQTGFVVTRGDDAALLERLEILIHNRELCRQMGEAGRAKAEREFGLDRLVSETLAAYRAAGWRDS